MKNYFKTTLLLATAGMALAVIAPSAKAQFTYSQGGDGNMFLGFYVPSASDTGFGTDYLLYIGNVSTYTTPNGSGAGGAYTGATITLYGTSGVIGTNSSISTDLANIFGSNWASTVKWGVVGDYDYLGASTVLITDPTATSTTAHWASQSASNQNGPAGIINSSIDTAGYGANSTTVGVTAANAVKESTSNTNSYGYFTPYGGSNGLNAGAGGQSLQTYQGDFNTTGTGSLKLDELNATDASPNNNGEAILGPNGDALVLGQFTLSNNGTITYAAVPEPSTYAIMGIGSLLLVMVARRRRSFLTA